MPALSPASVWRSIQKGAVSNEEWWAVLRRWTPNERTDTCLAASCRGKLRRRHDGSEERRRLDADVVRVQSGRLLALRNQSTAAVIHGLELNRRLLVLRMMAAARRADESLHLAQVKCSPAKTGGRDHRRDESICEAAVNHGTVANLAPLATPLKDQARKERGPTDVDRNAPCAS